MPMFDVGDEFCQSIITGDDFGADPGHPLRPTFMDGVGGDEEEFDPDVDDLTQRYGVTMPRGPWEVLL